jgi:TonB family protein
MAFRALLFSKSSETNAAMTAACTNAGIRAEVCSDIFTAIENGKTQPFSCVIADWADQPEASFLLKRARESAPNRGTIAIAIVDHDPTQAELRDTKLDFLIRRPISQEQASAVLANACEQMQPPGAESAAVPSNADGDAGSHVSSAASVAHDDDDQDLANQDQPLAVAEEIPEDDAGLAIDESQPQPRQHRHAMGLREACAAVLMVILMFCLWEARGAIEYLTQTPEGKYQVLRESVAALFYSDKTGALPASSAATDAQQDAYFSRAPSSNSDSNDQKLALGVAATESTLTETHLPLRKAPDFPLPVPVLQHEYVPPVHVERAAIPESMRNSAPMERPIVVTVTPAQMMPVSAPRSQPAIQQLSEPVTLSEDAARAMLVQMVNPVYPQEALSQKLHGPVVLQAQIGRDGSVQDLKIVRGYFLLGRAAIAAVKQWRFRPYTVNGQAAATQTLITINFNYPPG